MIPAQATVRIRMKAPAQATARIRMTVLRVITGQDLAAVLREITAGILMIGRNGIRIRTDMLTGSDPATIMARPDLPAALEQAQRRQGARKEGLS